MRDFRYREFLIVIEKFSRSIYSTDCDIRQVEDCNRYFKVDRKPWAYEHPTDFLPKIGLPQVLARHNLLSSDETNLCQNVSKNI